MSKQMDELPFFMEFEQNFKTSDSLIEVNGRQPLPIEKEYIDGYVTWEEVLIEYEKLGIEY